MTQNLHRRLFGLLSQLNLIEDRGEIVRSFTKGKKEHCKDLTDLEAQRLIKNLEQKSGISKEREQERENSEKLRKRLIWMAYDCGKDANFVKEWAENHGVRDKKGNLNKRLFNFYDTAELLHLICVFKKVSEYYKQQNIESNGKNTL